MKKTKRPVVWWIVFALIVLLMLAVLELGKHTLNGWVLTLAAAACFAYLNRTRLCSKGRAVRFGAWCAFFAVFAAILWVSWPPVRRVPAVQGRTGGVTEVVHVAQGDLTGVKTADGRVEVFTGIPYAQPPVGELRWLPPQPAPPWEGVLAADHFAPMSMQTTSLPILSSLAEIIGYHDYRISLYDNYRTPVSEDSLYLNIWRPAGAGGGLPVLVYVHGGSLQTGQPWYADYSGEGLARDGVIVVNMGYRLGIFGFFADEELMAESGTTGNYGLLDQIMALQWVQQNIAAFGGDPENVTLAGESAGAACVTALCTSPLASGLFRRAVGESSTVTAPQPAHSFRLMEEALAAGRRTRAKYQAGTIEALRALPAEAIVDEMNTHHHITVDGYVLPQTPFEAYRGGFHNEEAQLHGFNRDESGPFILLGQANLKNYESKVRVAFPGSYGDRVLALYPAATDAEARRMWADIYTAVLFTYGHYCWERQALENGIPSYVYYFRKANGRLGAWHGGEEMYLYGNIPESSPLFDGGDRELSRVMKQYFVNFIRTGDPNGEGLPAWPASAGQDRVLSLDDTIAVENAPYLPLYEILDEMNGWGQAQ